MSKHGWESKELEPLYIACGSMNCFNCSGRLAVSTKAEHALMTQQLHS